MSRKIILLALTGCFLSACTTPPRTLDEELNWDNPIMVSYLSSLTREKIGQPVKGVSLSDHSNVLSGSVLTGFAIRDAQKQHIYLFHSSDGYVAYAWVETGGKPLPIPKAATNDTGENAAVLSGDVYTFTEINPGDGVIVLSSATPAWLRGLQSSADRR